ncbi:MAG: hypothetical protein ABW161_16045 [Candidatus Thiodiazotropha sp.]
MKRVAAMTTLPGLCAAMFILGLQGCGSGSGQEQDPVVVDYPVAYVKRPITETTNTDIRVSQVSEAGGDLYLKDYAAGGPRRST